MTRITGLAEQLLLSLVNEVKDNPELKIHFELEKLIRDRIADLKKQRDPEELKFRKINLLRIIGKAGCRSFITLFPEYLQSEEMEIRNQAILSAGNTLDPDFIPGHPLPV